MVPLSVIPGDPRTVQEAEDNLRFIRELMERSTRHSTFSGLSGVFAGLISLSGCVVQAFIVSRLPARQQQPGFILNWGIVILLAIGIDYLLTKRRARVVGKRILSRLGKQMVLASLPGLGAGALITIYLLQKGMLNEVYPFWMLCYGTAICAVGIFSQRPVSWLGAAFLVAGAVGILLLSFSKVSPELLGLTLMGVSAGGFHILYGVLMAGNDGW